MAVVTDMSYETGVNKKPLTWQNHASFKNSLKRFSWFLPAFKGGFSGLRLIILISALESMNEMKYPFLK